MDAMPARYLTLNPCQDECGDLRTAERIDGSVVWQCPGCDSTWIELDAHGVPIPDPDGAA